MEYYNVAKQNEVLEGKAYAVNLNDQRIALVRLGGELFAFSDTCTHEHASLSEGFLEGFTIECPHHGALFDVRNGKALTLPATHDLRVYPVQIVGDDICIGLEKTIKGKGESP